MSLDHLENLLVERDGAVATITVNRPKVLNALNAQTLDELRRTILALKHDASVRVVIVTGAGEKSFIAGADINELSVQTPTGGRAHAMTGQHVLDLIEGLGKPVIAAINGYALGGGCELAMACTIRTRRHGEARAAGINLDHSGHAGTQAGAARRPRPSAAADRRPRFRARSPSPGPSTVSPAADLLAEARAGGGAGVKAPIAMAYIIDAVNKGLDIARSAG